MGASSHERFGAAVADGCALICPGLFVCDAADHAFWTTAVLTEDLPLGLVQRSRHTPTSAETPAALRTFSLNAVTFRGIDQIALEASDISSQAHDASGWCRRLLQLMAGSIETLLQQGCRPEPLQDERIRLRAAAATCVSEQALHEAAASARNASSSAPLAFGRRRPRARRGGWQTSQQLRRLQHLLSQYGEGPFWGLGIDGINSVLDGLSVPEALHARGLDAHGARLRD